MVDDVVTDMVDAVLVVTVDGMDGGAHMGVVVQVTVTECHHDDSILPDVVINLTAWVCQQNCPFQT
jgi:hypothetical protein